MKQEDIFALIDGLTAETSLGEFFDVYAKVVLNTMSEEQREAIAFTNDAFKTLFLCLTSPEDMVKKYKKLLKGHVAKKWMNEGESE